MSDHNSSTAPADCSEEKHLIKPPNLNEPASLKKKKKKFMHYIFYFKRMLELEHHKSVDNKGLLFGFVVYLPLR